MDYNEAREELKQHLKEYVDSITRPSKGRNMYICPLCGSGTGRNGTGAFNIDTEAPYRWICYSCGKSGDIFDLIKEHEGLAEPLDQLKRAGELYGLNIEECTKTAQKQPENEPKQAPARQDPTGSGTPDDFTAYYRECNDRANETQYFKLRGISDESIKRFMLGYDPEYKTGGSTWRAVIFPTGKGSYTARNTDQGADKADRYRKKGRIQLFNYRGLKEATRPVFITEGEIDALSIIEAGGEAVALGSTSNIDMFMRSGARINKQAQPFIICMDDDEKGREAGQKLADVLEAENIPFYRPDSATFYGGFKDANELWNVSPDELKQAVKEAEKEADLIKDREKEEIKEEYLKTSAYNYLQDFIDGIKGNANTPAQATGFNKLDMILDGGLYEGLYIIGAISSLGKTTIALQMADQIAQRGRDVLIISLEMARSELMGKSISRHTLIEARKDPANDTRLAKSYRGITDGKRWANYSKKELEIIQRAIESYGTYSKHIFIREGMGNIGVNEIKQYVKEHIEITGNSPVLLIDYVQILAPYDVRASDKQNTDKAVLELKRLSRDYKIPVIGISSFNRASYREEVTMEAFKESGSLEYGSDVLIGLQLRGAGTKDFNANDAKRKNPREIELVILKNRNGRTGDTIAYNYYPIFNYVNEVE